MAVGITGILNSLNQAGVFSYVIPFLLIFAVVYAILKKSSLLGDERPIITIVSAAIGLLALQFDIVSVFFANIFPKFGIGLSILLVLLILLGLFGVNVGAKGGNKLQIMGWIVGIAVIIWALANWNSWWSYGFGIGFGWWIQEYLWAIIIVALVIGTIFAVNYKGKGGSNPSNK